MRTNKVRLCASRHSKQRTPDTHFALSEQPQAQAQAQARRRAPTEME